jgi:crotonobetainyl-CoA:carnitine CoA-transferase CaiB-like acyl-CoA transferase
VSLEHEQHEQQAPLAGVRVVDLTSVLMGPFATQTLAEFGAEVIKVEPPEGDLVRGIGPMRNPGMGAIFLNANRGKKSVVFDLKTDAGRAALLRLVATADVFCYNLRPQAMQRLGLDWEVLRELNPRLIYCGMFGFARGGPYSALPAYDDIIQGASGLTHLAGVGNIGTPHYAPFALADRMTGLSAVNNVLAALVGRTRSGKGRAIDVTMFETMTRVAMFDHLQGETFIPALGPTGYARHLSRYRKPYATSDGWVCVMIYSDRHWLRFFDAIGRRDLLEQDPELATIEGRTQRIDELYGLVERELSHLDTRSAVALLESIDAPVMAMRSVDELLSDPHLLATGFIGEQQHPSEGRVRSIAPGATWHQDPLPPPGHAPRLGQHTLALLAELGYGTEEIEALRASRAVVAAG